jgi:antitoxin component of MazEF toxin-antitoxin module
VPAKENRKIMKHGTSGVIAIPKPYRDYHNLTPGNTVTVLYDSLLLIVPRDLEKLLHEKAALIDALLGQSVEALKQ